MNTRRSEKNDFLPLTVQALNSTAEPSGLAQILLVFGVFQNSFRFSDMVEQREKMNALKNAYDEII